MEQPKQPKRPPTITQVILKTSAITLFIAFAAFSYGLALFGLIAPRAMASLCDSLGAANGAGKYYERVYEAKKTPENLYIVLDRYIKAENHKKVIIYAEKFFDHNEYDATIKKVNERGAELAGGNEINLVNWANEDNRIKCRYTVALLETNQKSKADDKLYEWYSVDEIDVYQPLHAYFLDLGSWSERVDSAFANYKAFFEHETNVFAKDFLMLLMLARLV